MAGRRGRRLSEEERALWRQVARTAKPARPAPPPPPDDIPPAEIFDPPPPMQSQPEARPPRILRPSGAPEPPIGLPGAPAPASSGLDRRTEQRLRRGRRQPDDRIDLHGMTANRAHQALIRFVADSRRRGCRLVLVITGKGAPGAARDFGDQRPGIIRREAPVWLRTPPLAGPVVNVSQAHPRHGGGGALYVYLKRLR